MATRSNFQEIELVTPPPQTDSGDSTDVTDIESDDSTVLALDRLKTQSPLSISSNDLPRAQTGLSYDDIDADETNPAGETQSSLATKLKALVLLIKLGSVRGSSIDEREDRDGLSCAGTSHTTSQVSMGRVSASSSFSTKSPFRNLTLHPTGVGVLYWNLLICVVVTYNLFFLPIRFAFPFFQERYLGFWYSLDILADIYYLLDMAIQLRTSYLEQGCIVYDWKPIVLHYLFSNIFLIDIITILPVDLFRIHSHTTPYHNYIIFLRFIRFLKVYKIQIFVDRIEARSDKPNIIRIVAQVILLITIIHFNACIYFLISTILGYGSNAEAWAYPGTELRRLIGNTSQKVVIPDDFISGQYINCLHWSTQMLTTIGEVNAPTEHIEYIYATILLLFGVLMFATLVGNVGTIITNLNAARTRFESRLDNVKQYMDDRNINKGLKESVLRWFDHLWEKSRGIDEQETLQNLPNKLRARIAFNANRRILSSNPIYIAGDEGFKIDLMLRFRSELFPPNETIYEKGHIGNEMYIIRTGTVLLTDRENGEESSEIEEGEHFGISCIINFDEFGRERSESAKTIGFCDLLVLEKKDLLELLVDYPNVKVKLDQLFVEKHKTEMEKRNKKKRIEIKNVCTYVEKLSSHYDDLEKEFQKLCTQHAKLKARYPNVTF